MEMQFDLGHQQNEGPSSGYQTPHSNLITANMCFIT